MLLRQLLFSFVVVVAVGRQVPLCLFGGLVLLLWVVGAIEVLNDKKKEKLKKRNGGLLECRSRGE